MLNTAHVLELTESVGSMLVAIVTEAPVTGEMSVRLAGDDARRTRKATPAFDGAASLQPGDRVLVACDPVQHYYVIGVLERKQAPALIARDGTRALISHANGNEMLQVRDAADQLIFEYRPAEGKGTISMPTGNLALKAPHGDIVLEAGHSIHCQAGSDIELTGATAVKVAAGTEPNELSTQLNLTPRTATLTAKQLELTAKRGVMRIASAEYFGIALSSTIERVHSVVEKFESVADRIIQRVKDSYRQVDGLDQTKARRVRMLVKDAHYTKAGQVYVLADDDVKIDGNKIRLG
jgi:hypothetical protein